MYLEIWWKNGIETVLYCSILWTKYVCRSESHGYWQCCGVSVYALAFVLEADVLSTHWNKDCVIWHVWQWLFWETITVSHVCCYSANQLTNRLFLDAFILFFSCTSCTILIINKYSNAHFNYCVDGSIWHFKFPKVVQAHTLGEVGILGTVLLRVSSGTVLPIFIEIGSNLTDKEQKISWHSIVFLRHGLCMLNYCLVSRVGLVSVNELIPRMTVVKTVA